MPDRKTRKLTSDELRALGIDVPEENTAASNSTPESVSKDRKSRGALGWGAGLIARLGSGVLSSEGGPLGAAISGGGEYLAQKLESPDPVDPVTIGIEGGLGAIPFSKLIKAVKPGLSVGKQVLANAGRLAGFNEVGNMVRRYNKEGHILPQSKSEWLWDLGTMAAGGAVGGYAGKVKAGKAAEEIPKSVTPPPVDKIDTLLDDMARPVANPSVPERLARQGQAASGLGGLRIKPDTPPVKPITRSIGELGGPEIAGNAARVEEAAPLSGGASLERGITARKASNIHPEKIDSDGVVRQPDAVEQVLDEEIKKAAEIAKVQRKEHLRAQKAEEKLKRAEQTADTQNAKIEAGGTDLRQIEAKAVAQKAKDTLKDATQEARNLNARDKFVAKTEDAAAKQAKIEEATKKIDAMIEAGTAEPGPRILTETTEKVPTASGNQTLRQTVVEKLKKEGDADLAPRTPAPKPDALTGKVDIPVTDPNIVAKTKYSTQDAAVNALAGSGKVGSIQRLGRGKYRVIYEDAVKAAETAPETLPVASANAGKAEAPPVPVEAPVEAARPLPEAPATVPEAKEGPAKTAAPLVESLSQPAVKQSVNDLVIARKEAADKYFALKEAHAAGTASKEDLRAAGKAYGEADHALATAAKAEGKEADFSPVKPEKVAAPVKPTKADKTAGPDSNDLAAMPPDKQEKTLKDIVSKYNKARRSKPSSQEGAGGIELLSSLTGGLGGGLYGATQNPDDPLTGFLIGAGIGGAGGFYAPAAFRAVMDHLNSKTLSPEIEASSRQKVGQWVWDKGQTALQMMPDYYRASALSNVPSTIMNMWAGPYGSAVMFSIEHALAGDPRGAKALKELMNPKKLRFVKEYFKSWDEAQAKLSDAAERGGGEIGKHGPLWFRKATSFPAHLLTAGDVAARRILMESGFSELEARGGNLTSEPISGFMQGLGNMLKTKGPHGHPSWVGRMLLPFYRTNANQLEQGIVRIPVIGHGFRKYWKMTPIDKRLEIIQGAMSVGTGGVSYALGAITPQNKQKSALKFLSNFGGVYGTTMALAFVAGAASQNDGSAAKQLSAMSTRFLGQDMPLPSIDLATQSVNALKVLIDDDPDTSPKLPYGVVPPFLSSKQVVSLPTLLRGENPLSYDATVTKDEHFLAVPPFTKNVELKKEPKNKTRSERAVEKQKEMYAKYRKQIKDKAKQ